MPESLLLPGRLLHGDAAKLQFVLFNRMQPMLKREKKKEGLVHSSLILIYLQAAQLCKLKSIA